MDLPPGSDVEDAIPRRIETKDTLLKKYDIPIIHLDFSYVATCKDGKELERILHILQSGEEGFYPQLLSATEERLKIVKPNSKFIRKRTPVIDRNCLDKQTRAALEDEINDFVQNTSQYDSELGKFKQNEGRNANIPNVRSVSSINLETPTEKKSSRIKATDYASWDKYDPDTEMLKMDLKMEKVKNAQDRKVKEKQIKQAEPEVDYDGYTETEASIQSTQERLKGNEFYKTGDYSEALACYTKSIHINPSIEAYNNRAQVQIMLKNYKFAMMDSKEALKYDFYNIKANMRLAQCLGELNLYEKSITHLETIISVDPNNTNAQNLLNSIRSKLSKNQCSEASRFEEPTRLTITEVSSSESASSITKTINTNRRKLSSKTMPPEEKRSSQVLVPIPGPSHMQEPYYIAVDEDDPEMIKRVQLMLYNRPQLMYICHPDDSDTDDYSDSPRDYDIKRSPCRKGTSLGEINQRIEDFARSKTQYNRPELSSDEENNTSKMSVQWPNVNPSRKSSVEIFEAVTSDDDIGNDHIKNHVEFSNDKSNKSEKSEESYEYEDEELEDPFTGEEMNMESNADEPTYVNENNNNQDNITINSNEDDVKGGGGEPHLEANQGSDNRNEIIRTPYSFLRAWTALPTEYSYVQHANVLRNLNENRLSAGNKLDGRMLTDILRTLYMHFTVPHEVDRVYTIMTNLAALPRFKVISLFLSAQDSVMVGSLFEFLEQHGVPLPDNIKCAYV